MIYKPQALAFVAMGLIKRIGLLSILAVLAIVISWQSSPMLLIPILFLFFVACGYLILNRVISYKKESYEFTHNSIVRKSGTLFTNNETTVKYAQITHVSRFRPFLESKFFATEHVYVQTAGSRDAEVIFNSTNESLKLFALVQKQMKKNGFALSYHNKFLETQPSTAGIFIELFSMFFGTLVGIIFFIVSLGPIVSAFMLQLQANPVIGVLVLLFFILAFGGVAFTFVFKFLDKKMRKYAIYEDTITYSEGFLSRHESIIPMENISDARVDKSITDRLLGLATVAISCKGQGQEIIFAHMKHAKKIEELISTSVTHSVDEDFIKMDLWRTILPLIPLLIVSAFFPPLLFVSIPQLYQKISRLIGLKFVITSDGIKESFTFLTKYEREFVNRQITSVKIREGILDFLCGTYSITVTSLGADLPIEFVNVKKNDFILETILKHYAFPHKDEFHAQWTFSHFLKKFIVPYCALLVFACFGLLIGIVVPFLLIPLFFVILLLVIWPTLDWLQYRNAVAYVSSKHVVYTKGFFWKSYSYALFSSIKSITERKYPMTRTGSLILDVAGESKLDKFAVPNIIAMHYMPFINIQSQKFDKLLGVRDVKSLFSFKPQVTNGLLTLWFPAFWPLIPLHIWRISVQDYAVEHDRLIHRFGILYKSKRSILLHKIDHFQKNQGFIHKVCGNGSVLIYTTGSGSVDMIIGPVTEYEEVASFLSTHVSDS